MNDWEMISRRDGESTERLAVPGGWLYRSIVIPYSEGQSASVAMVFVPDPFPGYRLSAGGQSATPVTP